MALDIITSELLGEIQHGFFSRRGGASSGIYAGLNCGPGSEDQQEIVTANRARVADAMDLRDGHLLSVHQHHSPDVVTIMGTGWTDRPKADAMVTRAPGIGLGILTADCAPVLFADAGAGVVGAAHAGWKGAIGGVLPATVDAMVALGAERANIRAAVGPTISQRNYEVGPDFLDQFLDDDPGHSRFFSGGTGDRMQFDLPGFVLHQLREAGVDDIEWTGHCTYADPDRFFSYRRSTHADEADYGRLISVIRV